MNTTPPPDDRQALPDVVAILFDGAGNGRTFDPAELDGLTLDPAAFAWVHVKRDAPGADALLEGLCLDRTVLGALTAEETRPRCSVHEDGLLLNLRGVNLNPGAELEDMVSVRFWVTRERVIGVSVRPLFALLDVIEATKRGQGPVSPGDLTSKLALRLADRAEPLVTTLNERIDALEEAVMDDDTAALRPQLSKLRRSAIMLRRYMAPQKDALTTMEIEDVDWLGQRDRIRLREAAERVGRLDEDLDAIRDRAQVVHDQIMDQRAEALNQRMLILAVISAIFLPLGLIAGLMGMNVGGIPGTSDPWGFWVVVGLIAVLAVGLGVWLRATGLFR